MNHQLDFDNAIQSYSEQKETDKNHVATPRYVVEDIYELINVSSFKMLWFPFNNYDSQFKLFADELKLTYKATHKFDDCGNDFFTTTPPTNCDLMISNPPFENQNEIIKRSFELIDSGLIKSFASLLPLATLETKKRADMFEQYSDKLSIIVFKNRIKFLGHGGKSFNKGCCWICYNIEALKDKPFSWI